MIGKNNSFRLGLLTSLLILGLLAGLVGIVEPVQAVPGSYVITFRAADPELYIPPIPYPGVVFPPPSGRADGEDYIPMAWFESPLTGTDVHVSALEPSEMALGQIVPFEIKIAVNGSTEPEGGCITFVGSWSTLTSSGQDFGYDHTIGDYGVYGAFIDIGDGAHVDLGEAATVSSFSGALVGTEIHGTFYVCGLDSGDTVVLEVWMVLDKDLPPGGANNNVASGAENAYTGETDSKDTAITLGVQTVGLQQTKEFETTMVYLDVYKFDDNEPKAIYPPDNTGDIWKNTIVVTAGSDGTGLDYVANGVTIIDTLDDWVQIVSTDYYDADTNPYGIKITEKLLRTCSYVAGSTHPTYGELGGKLTCELGAVPEAGTNTAIVEYWLRAVPGAPLGSVCEGDMEIDPATSVASECLPTWLSPTGYDVMNRVDLTSYSTDATPDDNWDEEPKDIVSPNAVEIEYFTATGLARSILLEWKTVVELNNLGFNIYRAVREDAPRVKINAELIPSNIFGQGGSVYEYLDTKVSNSRIYYYWLEDVDFDGTTTLYGPVFAKAGGARILNVRP